MDSSFKDTKKHLLNDLQLRDTYHNINNFGVFSIKSPYNY